MVACVKKSIIILVVITVLLTVAVFALDFNKSYVYAAEGLDMTFLTAAITEAKTYDEADYSKESWSVMKLALADAETALNNPVGLTQQNIDTYTLRLSQAIADLTVDRDLLLTMLFKAENIIETKYEEQGIIELKEVIRIVLNEITVLDLPQHRVDELCQLLDETINLLVRLIECPDALNMYINDFFEIDIIPTGGEWEYDSEFFMADEETGKLVAIKIGTTQMHYTSLQGQTKTITVTILNPPDYTMIILVIILVIIAVLILATIIFLVLRAKQQR